MVSSERVDTESSISPRAAKPGPPVVLQLLPSLETGGVERGTVEIAEALASAGWVPLVASSGGRMVREVERAGATHLTFPADSKNPAVMWRNIGGLERLIARHGVDLLHVRSRAPAWSAVAAARRAGIPLVTTFHGNYAAGSAVKRLYNSVMIRGDRVIAISNFIAEQVTTVYGAAPARVRVIPRGVDLRVFDLAVHQVRRDARPLVELYDRVDVGRIGLKGRVGWLVHGGVRVKSALSADPDPLRVAGVAVGALLARVEKQVGAVRAPGHDHLVTLGGIPERTGKLFVDRPG